MGGSAAVLVFLGSRNILVVVVVAAAVVVVAAAVAAVVAVKDEARIACYSFCGTKYRLKGGHRL